MKPLFLIRPEPGWSVSAETARAMGLDVHGTPLFTIEPVAWDAPDSADFDGLLVGSANTFRHGGKQLAKLTKLPVHAVGEATADAARAAGFLIGRTGRGGLQNLLDELSKRELRLLRLAGADRVTLRLPDGIRVETRTVYRAVPEGLAGVEFDRHKLDRARVDLAVIGPRVAELAGEGWRSVSVADAPGDSELLALAEALCQTDA